MAQNFRLLNQPDSLSHYMEKMIEANKLLENATELNYIQTYHYNNLTIAGHYGLQGQWELAKWYLDKGLPYKNYNAFGYMLSEFEYCIYSMGCNDLDGLYQKLLNQETNFPISKHPSFLILQALYFEKTGQ